MEVRQLILMVDILSLVAVWVICRLIFACVVVLWTTGRIIPNADDFWCAGIFPIFLLLL